MEMGDDKVDPSGPMKLAANAIRGNQAPEEMVSKMVDNDLKLLS